MNNVDKSREKQFNQNYRNNNIRQNWNHDNWNNNLDGNNSREKYDTKNFYEYRRNDNNNNNYNSNHMNNNKRKNSNFFYQRNRNYSNNSCHNNNNDSKKNKNYNHSQRNFKSHSKKVIQLPQKQNVKINISKRNDPEQLCIDTKVCVKEEISLNDYNNDITKNKIKRNIIIDALNKKSSPSIKTSSQQKPNQDQQLEEGEIDANDILIETESFINKNTMPCNEDNYLIKDNGIEDIPITNHNSINSNIENLHAKDKTTFVNIAKNKEAKTVQAISSVYNININKVIINYEKVNCNNVEDNTLKSLEKLGLECTIDLQKSSEYSAMILDDKNNKRSKNKDQDIKKDKAKSSGVNSQPYPYSSSIINENRGNKTDVILLDCESEKSFINNFPWITEKTSQTFGEEKLHYEIIDFFNYIKPNREDYLKRNITYYDFLSWLKENFPKWKIKLYGSFAVDLFLKNSDIDIVIFTNDDFYKSINDDNYLNESDYTEDDINFISNSKNLQESKKENEEKKKMENGKNLNLLKSQMMSRPDLFDSVENFGNRVPIIRCRFKKTDCNIDISFNKIESVEDTAAIKLILSSNPSMRCFYLVIKYFFYQNDLIDTFNGKMSSYVLFLLVLAFYIDFNTDRITTVGRLFIEFLNFHSFGFNYFDYEINCCGNPLYLKKSNMENKNQLIIKSFNKNCNKNAAENLFNYITVRNVLKKVKNSLLYFVEEEPHLSYLTNIIDRDYLDSYLKI